SRTRVRDPAILALPPPPPPLSSPAAASSLAVSATHLERRSITTGLAGGSSPPGVGIGGFDPSGSHLIRSLAFFSLVVRIASRLL
ncbi:hypothetical protein ABZP36_008744, partial [Zizania latifolia]